LNDRNIKMPIESKIKRLNMLRSREFPSSIACDADCTNPPSHCEGNLDATINIQITGTHKASEVFGSFAGS
jgi:hypothetical protein